MIEGESGELTINRLSAEFVPDEHRPPAAVADNDAGEALESLWAGQLQAPGTPAAPQWVPGWPGAGNAMRPGRAGMVHTPRAPPDSETPVRSRRAIARLVARREVALREKTFYETAGRAEEILALNIEDLDLAGRSAAVMAKGARAKTRLLGQARGDVVLETVYWDAGTVRLLPRLFKGRARGPEFVTHRRPAPGKVFGPRDAGPDTELARLSYGRSRALLDAYTALRGPGTGWGSARVPPLGVDPPRRAGRVVALLMAKSRQKTPENLRRYFKPSGQAIAEVTSLLAFGDART
ncbi:hypothetical protein SAMN04487820_103313 [Actinopolyspora mzabensis]|uniref:Uncharacterized protein n=1 Tax=Actinopolyspora mzabensis TaxID=995066 RepID=A0A1G8Y8D3_ACTMZ|nr:hypothetical protein [Actinopolyspora mzabensis]SDJ99058.1 hypothetical protein SAMN04487820_103313 [Actinopolyspora mzabensis]